MKLFLSKTILLILLAASLNAYSQNPNWEWAKIAGGSGKDAGQKIAIDSQGDVYVLGSFRDNNMVLGSITLANAGDDDVFLAKYDALGNLIWAKSIGSTGTEFGTNLLIDKYDDIYVSGGFSSPNITIGTTTLPNSGGFDFFIAKYNPNGQVLWAKNSSNSNFNAGLVAIDADLNTYSIIGTTSTANIEKYDALENLIWSRPITTTGSISSISYRGFYVDSSGVYITGGFFGSSLTIGSITLINTTAQNSNDMYIAKLDTAGNVLWAKNAIIAAGDHGTKVVIDRLGNSYVLGQFSGTATFDSHSITSNGQNDLFLVKYNPSGQVIWAKNAGGNQNDWVNGLVLDTKGSAYIIGEFYSPSFTFANTTFNNMGVWFSYADVFVLKYDSLGNEVWIKNIEGLGNDNGNDVAINNIGEVYITGAIEDTLGGTTNIGNFPLVSYGLDDIFIAKLSQTLSIDQLIDMKGVSVYPNPNRGKFIIEINNTQNAKIEIYNISGQLIYQKQTVQSRTEIDLNVHSKGIYFIKVNFDKEIVIKKMVCR